MKTITTLATLCTSKGFATIGPADFANRCMIERYGLESPHSEECAHYEARSYAIQCQMRWVAR